MNDNKSKAIKNYISKVNELYVSKNATEHSYRPALANLLESLLPSEYKITNEPTRIECGAPDYIITKKTAGLAIPVAFIEAKDIKDNDLDGNDKHKEQFNRYKKSLDHILFTDYIDFHLYEFGSYVDEVCIAKVINGKISAIESNFSKFCELIERFSNSVPQKISNPEILAKMMASKTQLLAQVLENELKIDIEKKKRNDDSHKPSETFNQWESFKKNLIHSLSAKQFADIYAQTICYGMFVARLYDETPDSFSRIEAAELIPKTNPFLRKIFQNIATFDVNGNISWIIDNLVETFRVTDIHKVMKNFGKGNGQKDPIVYFYELFLKEYDPKQKVDCGVFYTPEPAVNFIVNSVDEILKDKFNLPLGLADSSTESFKRSIESQTDNRTTDHKKHEQKTFKKVQILDPATGTGTFLAKVVQKIHSNINGQLGAWQNYVEEHLLPRLNGFEFMMAPYVIAHLKMDMVLEKTGYDVKSDQRVHIFLTNSLEEADKETDTLFASWLSDEARNANNIKRNTPVMVMIGNPPYNGKSKNKDKWIQNLIKDYKKDLNEKKINLDDDYIKFIRLGQHFVEKNGDGILAYITNNSFIDGITHRQMRKQLMKAFDEIYILDLHGSSKKHEICPDGSKDENVFDITLGVSINIFIKKQSVKSSNKYADVFHYDVYGSRSHKYDFLNVSNVKTIPWNILKPQKPYYFFTPKDFSGIEKYERGFKIDELMQNFNSGVQTKRDYLNIFFNDQERLSLLENFISKSVEDLKIAYETENGRDWKIEWAKRDLQQNDIIRTRIFYRPFDLRYTNYTGTTKGIMGYPREKTNFHLKNENITLITSKQLSTSKYQHTFVSKEISDLNSVSLQSKEQSYVFPLYLYSDENSLLDSSPSAQNDTGEITQNGNGLKRKPNLDEEIWRKIDKCIQITGQAGNDTHATTPEQIFDYIYGVLHTPSYREKYKEFLKVDFPRIPYPKNAEKFNQIVTLGNKLRKLHLMEEIPQCQTSFDIAGDNVVSELHYEPADSSKQINGRVFINKVQYFDNIPELAWNFYIGGYQPAQKWLKDRKGRALSYDDISHYRKIIAILIETDNLMKELDLIC